jgi:hypothetical protein
MNHYSGKKENRGGLGFPYLAAMLTLTLSIKALPVTI